VPKGFTQEDAELLDELGVGVEPNKISRPTVREERIIAGFEEIQRFVDRHGWAPGRAAGRDIFERLCAVRLDRIIESEECRRLLAPVDRQGLLREGDGREDAMPDARDDDALLAELGMDGPATDITELRHVRSSAEKQAAEQVASRTKCGDFERFRSLFELVQRDIERGIRETRPFGRKSEIEAGRFFVVGGQKAYVASMGRVFTQQYGDKDARLRVIFDNGTESNLLRRSLQRALHKDPAGRRITEPTDGPLFAGQAEEGDELSGTVYVLRSKSDLPQVAKHRQLIHKIGVTSGDVQERIAGARLQPTFLMADVEIVATYQLFGVDRSKLERLIHRVFGHVRLDIEIIDRFGNPVRPREWFLVPRHVIDQAIERIRDGTITRYAYDRHKASLVGSDRG